jgi:hypothetical protein
MRRCWSSWLYLSACTGVLAGVLATYAGTAAAQPQDAQSTPEDKLQEVTVTAIRKMDPRTLSHAVTGFVESHSAPGMRINQLGRWDDPVCPFVTGLQRPAQEFIVREILDVARDAGAPAGSVGKKCEVTVEIVFTRQPQALLDHIAKDYRLFLGFFPRAQWRQMTTFSRPIQAWYVTGTRSTDVQQLPIAGMGASSVTSNFGVTPADVPILSGAQIDSDVTAMGMQPSGTAGSYLGRGLRSEFAHVLIIADSAQVERFPLQTIADYVAMLSLTRMAQLDRCAPLPSITDLLVSGCTAPVSDSLTAADRVYLKALYSADLDKNLNIERADIKTHMMRQLEGK